MALVYENMPCAICLQPIPDPNHDTFATTMWGIRDPRFIQLDDTACHQSCIDNWPMRDEFIDYYNHHCNDELRINRRGHVCYKFRLDDFLLTKILMPIVVFFLLPGIPLGELRPLSDRWQRFCAILPLVVLPALVAFCVASYGWGRGMWISMGVWISVLIVSFITVRLMRD
jgi:hypothetical protein